MVKCEETECVCKESNTKKAVSEYEINAVHFLKKTGAKITASFLYHGKHFDDDKDARDVYSIIIERGDRKPMTFNFGQSIVKSGTAKYTYWNDCKAYSCEGVNFVTGLCRKHGHRREAPTSYDVLACLTKGDPGTFRDFCGDFGCDDDSIKAREVYFKVQEEWSNVNRLFGDVLEALQEIQ